MCYAFTYIMQSEAATVPEEAGRSTVSAQVAETSPVQDDQASQTRKRGASATLDSRSAKVAKTSTDGGKSPAARVAEVGSGVESGQGGEETVEVLRKKLQESTEAYRGLRERANKTLGERNQEIAELKTRARDAEAALAELEVDHTKLDADYKALKKSRANGPAKDTVRQIQENAERKNEKKITDLNAKYQKAVAGLKEGNRQMKADLTQKNKEEIKKCKEENSKEIKEKREAAKMNETQIMRLEKDVEQLKAEKVCLEEKIRKFDACKAKNNEKINEYRQVHDKDQNFIASMGREYAAKTDELKARLEFANRKLEKQGQILQQSQQSLVAQQRTNFVQRNGNDSKIQKLETLMREMQRLRGLPPGGSPGGMGAASAQTLRGAGTGGGMGAYEMASQVVTPAQLTAGPGKGDGPTTPVIPFGISTGSANGGIVSTPAPMQQASAYGGQGQAAPDNSLTGSAPTAQDDGNAAFDEFIEKDKVDSPMQRPTKPEQGGRNGARVGGEEADRDVTKSALDSAADAVGEAKRGHGGGVKEDDAGKEGDGEFSTHKQGVNVDVFAAVVGGGQVEGTEKTEMKGMMG